MVLPIIYADTSIVLNPEPITPSAFSPFGTAVTSPLPSDITSYSAQILLPAHPKHQPQPVPANQQTALKTSPISPATNNYPSEDLSAGRNKATCLMSIFSSFPRRNAYLDQDPGTNDPSLRLKLGILERHPFTTQTFCPFNYSEPSTTSCSLSGADTDVRLSTKDQVYALVVVAPTLTSPPSDFSQPRDPPDLSNIRAFLTPLNDSSGKTSSVAVTYAPGTWHAPMIVLGSRRVDFLVTQFANGKPDDDCQEVLIGSGPDENSLSESERQGRANRRAKDVQVEVDVSFLLEGYETGAKIKSIKAERTTNHASWRAVGVSRGNKL